MTVKIVDTIDGERPVIIKGHMKPIKAICWNAIGSHLVSVTI